MLEHFCPCGVRLCYCEELHTLPLEERFAKLVLFIQSCWYGIFPSVIQVLLKRVYGCWRLLWALCCRMCWRLSPSISDTARFAAQAFCLFFLLIHGYRFLHSFVSF